MNFILKPSLTHMAFVSTAAALWNKHHIRESMKKFFNSQSFSGTDFSSHPRRVWHCEEWQEIVDIVRNNVLELPLPTTLVKEFLYLIHAVGNEILMWMEYHLKCCNFDVSLPNLFYWTSYGTIDKSKTAKALIKDETIDIVTRYKLACLYCFESHVAALWYKLPEIQKISFYDEENLQNNLLNDLFIFWGLYLRKIEVRTENMIKRLNSNSYSDMYMFNYAARTANKAALEYFLENLKQEKVFDHHHICCRASTYAVEHHCGLLTRNPCPPLKYYSEVFCFLFSYLNAEDQEVDLTAHSAECLLDWPYQEFFPSAVNNVCLEDSSACCEVLNSVIDKVKHGYKDYNYHNLFQDAWQQVPCDQKNHFVSSNYRICGMLRCLLELKDEESVKSIMQHTPPSRRKEFIFSDIKDSLICEDFIYRGEWDTVKFFVPLCISSKDDMIKFKEEFQKYIKWKKRVEDGLGEPCFLISTTDNRLKSNLEIFYQLLDDLLHAYDKRKSTEDDDSNPTKKINTDNTDFKK